MPCNAKILCDSISPDGVRLTTMEVTLPRIVLAEFNTHRMFSRNSASSRAIPVEKQIKRVLEDPFIPLYWGKNQKGMQANEELSLEEQTRAQDAWLSSRDLVVERARRLLDMGIHKQLTNRLLEPFMWHTIIVTATEWNNFFALRKHPDAQPEIRIPAELMWKALQESEPNKLDYEQWHLPLVLPEELEGKWDDEDLIELWKMISVGRCARVSYLTHDGKRDPAADVELASRLKVSGHMSPYEHVARPMLASDPWFISADLEDSFCGNFRGWVQFRKELPNESDFSQMNAVCVQKPERCGGDKP